MGKYRKLNEKRGWGYGVAVPIVKPFLLATTKPEWIDGDKIPETGGCVLVINHISHIDPFTAAHITWEHGRMSRYLAKAGLFKNKQLAAFLRAAGQIPVERTTGGVNALQAAIDAVTSGELVVVYPEGSITKDPDGWPMRGKTGAARIALATGCPVIPIGQWGAQDLLPAYSLRLRPFPRKTVKMKVGEPIDMSDLLEKGQTPETVNAATDRIMGALIAIVAELRGEKPPPAPFDPKKAGVAAIGNPKKNAKKNRSAS